MTPEILGYNASSSESIVNVGELIGSICRIIILFIVLFLLSWFINHFILKKSNKNI